MDGQHIQLSTINTSANKEMEKQHKIDSAVISNCQSTLSVQVANHLVYLLMIRFKILIVHREIHSFIRFPK